MKALGRITLAGVLFMTLCLPLQAEVVQSSEAGFSVSHTRSIAAPPQQVWDRMTRHIDEWWNGEHSWSADASNLYIEPEVGKCFCERLPDGGFVEHLRVIFVAPGKEIRFDGALGPLQTMAASGRMIWTVKAAESGSEVTFTYHVHGTMPGGLGQIAPAVDGVIGEQLSRLRALYTPTD